MSQVFQFVGAGHITARTCKAGKSGARLNTRGHSAAPAVRLTHAGSGKACCGLERTGAVWTGAGHQGTGRVGFTHCPLETVGSSEAMLCPEKRGSAGNGLESLAADWRGYTHGALETERRSVAMNGLEQRGEAGLSLERSGLTHRPTLRGRQLGLARRSTGTAWRCKAESGRDGRSMATPIAHSLSGGRKCGRKRTGLAVSSPVGRGMDRTGEARLTRSAFRCAEVSFGRGWLGSGGVRRRHGNCRANTLLHIAGAAVSFCKGWTGGVRFGGVRTGRAMSGKAHSLPVRREQLSNIWNQ